MAGVTVMAQPGWKWPEDVETAKEKNALYSDAVKSKDWATAQPAHQWLLDNCPDLNKSIYVNGVKIYDALQAAEKDPVKKVELQEKCMQLFDDRIKYFGDEANVLDRKASKAYKYFKQDKTKLQDLLSLYQKVYEMKGEKVADGNLLGYMDVIRRCKGYKIGDLTDESIIDRYSTISDIFDAKLADPNKSQRSKDYLVKAQASVDQLFSALVEVDCEFIESKFAPKMRETKNVKLAKKIFKLMLNAKCTDSPTFIEAGEIVFAQEPDAGMAKVIAIKYGASKDYAKATEWYDKALGLTDDNLTKAEIHLAKAKTYRNQGYKSKARSSAKQALSNDPSMKNAYVFIGDLYYASYDDCKKGESRVDDRLVFIAAYGQYAKAGNSALMKKAKAQFPSIGEIFELGLEEGQSMTVGCWINETVKLQKRPAE